MYSGCSGLQIAYLSGTEAQQQPAPAHSFSAKDVAELKTSLLSTPNFRGVDILLTSPWPRDVGTYANSAVSVLFPGFHKGLPFCLLWQITLFECLRKLGVKTGKADALVLQRRRTEGKGICETSGHFICPCHFLSVFLFISFSIGQVVWFFLSLDFEGIASFVSNLIVLMFLNRSDFQMI